jgi:hypothetical protein
LQQFSFAHLHGWCPCATQNISPVLTFPHKSGKPCGNRWISPANLPNFNAMMRFAPFLCNPLPRSLIFPGVENFPRQSKLLQKNRWLTTFFSAALLLCGD